MSISRRDFLKVSLCSGLSFFACDHFLAQLSAASYPQKKADFFHVSENKNIICDLCHHSCEIRSGNTGICRSRIHKNGDLYSLTYNCPVAIHLDPIEKVPMRHVLPGEKILCIGTAGCNFSCLYCINHHISQKSPKDIESFSKTPDEIVKMALNQKVPAIAFTYNEPTVAYEFMYETFSVAKENGLKTFFHTNGFMKAVPLKALIKVTDGIVVDLKAFSLQNYRMLTNGGINEVKENLRLIYNTGCFLEIVNLLVPTYNDSNEEIQAISTFVSKELSNSIPFHFSRFFPKFKLSHLSPTTSYSISKAIGIARQNGLNFVYANNIKVNQNDTYCPRCGKAIVKRQGINVPTLHIDNGHCSFCGQEIPGIWRA